MITILVIIVVIESILLAMMIRKHKSLRELAADWKKYYFVEKLKGGNDGSSV